jgi:predicted outer membrane repeat protein
MKEFIILLLAAYLLTVCAFAATAQSAGINASEKAPDSKTIPGLSSISRNLLPSQVHSSVRTVTKNYPVNLNMVKSTHGQAEAVVCYLTPEGAGAMDGTSWANAYPGTRVQTAINKPGITEVWIKKGTYTPDSTGANDYWSSWKMKNNVAIYGGFNGTETSLAQRTDYGLGGSNETILSGYGTLYYSFHIFSHVYESPTFISLNSTAVLDGFTIKTTNWGAIYNHGNPSAVFTPTIRNCIFTNNLYGCIDNYYSSPNIANCTFVENLKGYDGYQLSKGGVIYNEYSSPIIYNCIFNSNSAWGSGGAICDTANSMPEITCCTFISNHCEINHYDGNSYGGNGGAIYNDATSPTTIVSCLFYSNTSEAGGGAIYNRATYPFAEMTKPTAYISNCTFYNNQSSEHGGAIYCDGSYLMEPLNCIIRGNTATGLGNNIYIKDSRLLAWGCCFTNGTNDIVGSGTYEFLDFNNTTDDPMFVNSTTGDLRLNSGSGCANMNEPLPYLTSTDVRGNTRVQDGFVDTGCYEWTIGTDPFTQNTWTGATDSDWKKSGNWNLGFAPTKRRLCDVAIPEVTNDPIVNQATIDTAYVNNLTIQAGAVLTISAGKAFTVNGSITNSAGATGLVIKSTISGTGSLIHNTPGIAGTLERYIAAAEWGTWNDGWHFVSSPVADHAITGAFTVTPADEYDFYAWSEKYNKWINFKESVAPLFADSDVNGSSTFEMGKGYMAAYKTTDAKLFAGNLNVADVAVANLTISSGQTSSWHLLGNPFASAITWYTGWTKSNIGGVANIWSEPGQSYSPINADGIIPSGNGFMVNVSGGTGSLTIPAASRVHSAQAWYKNSSSPVIKLFAHNLDYPSYQESQVSFNPDATTGFDMEYDGRFIAGYAPLFYSVMAGENLMVNSLPQFREETVIPFSFIKNEGTNFSIEATGIETLSEAENVYLLDRKLGINHNLLQNPVYTFTSSEGDATARFELRFSTVGIIDLPVTQTIGAWYYGGNLMVKNREGLTRIDIFNIQGKNLQNHKLQGSGLQKVSLNLPVGIYFARIMNHGAMQTVKIIVP